MYLFIYLFHSAVCERIDVFLEQTKKNTGIGEWCTLSQQNHRDLYVQKFHPAIEGI